MYLAMEKVIDQLRWKKFPVLDDGFVTLVDVMGDDSAIVQAARVSYGAGTKTISDDRALIRYLMRHEHTSPFEMAELKFMVRVPMDIWRQWIRHRTASVNEYSTRYSIAIDSAHRTAPSQWRYQSKQNKQGSYGFLPDDLGEQLSEEERQLHAFARQVYRNRIEMGVAREQARKDLPLSTYTEAYWKIDLHNLLHFLELRMNPAAQLEIRQYAEIIGNEIVAKLFPITWEAFLDYRLHAVKLSKKDQEVLEKLIRNGKVPATYQDFLLCQCEEWQPYERCREREECYEKLRRIGIVM